jgi:hypothetical protein
MLPKTVATSDEVLSTLQKKIKIKYIDKKESTKRS